MPSVKDYQEAFMKDAILFPCSFFSMKEVDECYQKEYEAALAVNGFDIIFYNYDDFVSEGILRLNHVPEEPMNAIYRGWMLKPEQYKDFYEKLQQKNINLITSPGQYSYYHDFSNSYQDISKTPDALFFPEGEKVELKKIKKRMSRFMLKDYVKSVKETDFPKFFNADDLTQEELDSWILKFKEHRGKLFTGGICVKKYVDLRKYEGRTNEWRVFYIKGEPIVCANSGQSLIAPKVPMELVQKYVNPFSPFYTIDYAELEDGSWKVLETGDGQVSGLCDNQDAYSFYRAIKNGLGYYEYIPSKLRRNIRITYESYGEKCPGEEDPEILFRSYEDYKTAEIRQANLNLSDDEIPTTFIDYEAFDEFWNELKKLDFVKILEENSIHDGFDGWRLKTRMSIGFHSIECGIWCPDSELYNENNMVESLKYLKIVNSMIDYARDKGIDIHDTGKHGEEDEED